MLGPQGAGAACALPGGNQALAAADWRADRVVHSGRRLVGEQGARLQRPQHQVGFFGSAEP